MELRRRRRMVGYAVVGLGHIAQTSVLPAFKNAKKNSRLVALVSSDAATLAHYRLVGSEGELQLDPAYEYSGDIEAKLTRGEKVRTRTFKEHDQFGPEILEFSHCILDGREPEANGLEGLADVRIIESIGESLQQHRTIRLEPVRKLRRPEPEAAQAAPPVGPGGLVHTEAPHQ